MALGKSILALLLPSMVLTPTVLQLEQRSQQAQPPPLPTSTQSTTSVKTSQPSALPKEP